MSKISELDKASEKLAEIVRDKCGLKHKGHTLMSLPPDPTLGFDPSSWVLRWRCLECKENIEITCEDLADPGIYE